MERILLKIAVDISKKIHIFIVNESGEKDSDALNRHKIEFTQGELKQINDLSKNKFRRENISINLIKIHKTKGRNKKITIEIENKKIDSNDTSPRCNFTKVEKSELIDSKKTTSI